MDANDNVEVLPQSTKSRINAMLVSPCWKIVNSGLVVALITIGISTCHKAEDAKVAADDANEQIVDLKAEVTNSIQQIMDLRAEVKNSIQNDIKIVNQSVTRVEKEIANVKEAVHDIYEMVERETFHKEDENVRIKLVKLSDKLNGVLIRLSRIPEVNSIRITNQQGISVPSTTMRPARNVVGIQISQIAKLFANEESFYEVSYIPDFSANRPLYSLDDITIVNIDEGRFRLVYKEE
jgi:uncharacterized protein YfkK (UPF0435 family)